MAADKVFLGRQPILDRSGRINGYELLFRSGDIASANVVNEKQASCDVIFKALSTFGIEGILGSHKGFINVDRSTLMDEVIELLPVEQVVFEILESVVIDRDVVSRCRELKAMGFSLALDDHVCSDEYEPLYEVVDIVKLDILAMSGAQVEEAAARLRSWPLRLLAEKVETGTQHDRCLSMGFELFQGYYFAKPSILSHKKPDFSRLTLLTLLNQLLSDAELLEVEMTFKCHPNLTYSLLRLVNSVAYGVVEKISSIGHAITYVGQQQLKRWTLLAMFACGEQAGEGSPLLELVVMRSRLMELLADRCVACKVPQLQELAFITGTLSLVDVLFDAPLEEILNHLNLQEEIRLALLERGGLLGDLLQVAEHLEMSGHAQVAPLIEGLGISMESLLDAQLQSISWSNNFQLTVARQ